MRGSRARRSPSGPRGLPRCSGVAGVTSMQFVYLLHELTLVNSCRVVNRLAGRARHPHDAPSAARERERGPLVGQPDVAASEVARSEVARSEVARWSLIAIALLMAPAGLQAAFAPRSFFDDFPLGRGWI